MTELTFTQNGTTYHDLTDPDGSDNTDGVIGGDRTKINGAVFTNFAPNSTSGTGVISAFVRVQATGDEEGYNYDNPDENRAYDENTSPSFTRNLLLSEIPIVTLEEGGISYYEFRLDINQTNANPYLSLDKLQVYTSSSAASNFGTIGSATFTDETDLVYDMDEGGNNSVLLDYSLQAGSGRSDMFFYVPVTNFNGAVPEETFVVLYSAFGQTDDALVTDAGNVIPDHLQQDYSSNDGFEEWSVSKAIGDVYTSGYKWKDTDGDGTWDLNENGLGGFRISWEYDVTTGKGANAVTTTYSGVSVTGDGLTDVDGDGDIDAEGFYVIPIFGSADNYSIKLVELFEENWVNTYDGDAVADRTTVVTFTTKGSGNNPPPPLPVGDYGVTEQLNFGNFEYFNISGTKYTDTNGDGLTTGDLGLGGVTVFIDVNKDGDYDAGTDQATTTADNGTWSFNNLGGGYAGLKVYEVLPSGYVQTLGVAGYTITGTSGTDQTGLDFANFKLFSVSGTKYTDNNGDGQTTGDSGLGGVTIFIDMDGSGTNTLGDKVTTTAAGTGAWSFNNLDWTVAGKTVYEVLPNGYVQTLGDLGYTITGTSGANQIGLNFANFELFNISGTKFTDTNGDGLTTGDSGLGGVTVFIDVNEDGDYDAGTDQATTTAADGTWSFNNLGVGYAGLKVYEVLPNGYVQTLGTAGYTITGTSGADQTGLDFANFEKFNISGTKYTDTNGDGLTTGDLGLGGVTVFIDVNKDGDYDVGTDQATTTAANGTWSFNDLGVGYAGLKVYEVLPDGYVQTLGTAGYTITGTSGADQTGLNFANFEKFDISGFKWADLNQSGTWDEATSSVLGGWTIVLDNNTNPDDGFIASRVTGANGAYSFNNLAPGAYGNGTLVSGTTYYVYELQNQDGFTQTYGGFNFTLQSGADITGDLGQTEDGNFGNHMMTGANRTPGFWQSVLGQSFYDGIDTNNGDANGDGIVDGVKDYNKEGWSEVDLLTKYGVDTNADGKNDSFLVYSDGVAGVTGGDILLTPTQLADWVGGTGTSLEMLERAVGAAFLNTLNNHSISEPDGDATGNAFDLFAYMDNEIEDSYLAAIAFIKKFDDGSGPGQYDNGGTAWDGETNANKNQQKTDWNAYGNAAHTELAAYNENGEQSSSGKLSQFKMDGDDYSSALVQGYLAVQGAATSAGDPDAMNALMGGGGFKLGGTDTIHLL